MGSPLGSNVVARFDMRRKHNGFISKTTMWYWYGSEFYEWPNDPFTRDTLVNTTVGTLARTLANITPIPVSFVESRVTIYDLDLHQIIWRQWLAPDEVWFPHMGVFPSDVYYREFSVAVDLVPAVGRANRLWLAFVPETIVLNVQFLDVAGLAVYNLVINNLPDRLRVMQSLKSVAQPVTRKVVQPRLVTHNHRRLPTVQDEIGLPIGG